MNNKLKFKTRISFIQIIFQHLSTGNDINEILTSFNKNYKNIIIENFHDKKKIKFEFSSVFLGKLTNFYIDYVKSGNHLGVINSYIDIERKFEKWDIINQSLLIGAISEIKNIEIDKMKISLNDYLNLSKLFISQTEIGILNAVLDKLINDKK